MTNEFQNSPLKINVKLFPFPEDSCSRGVSSVIFCLLPCTSHLHVFDVLCQVNNHGTGQLVPQPSPANFEQWELRSDVKSDRKMSPKHASRGFIESVGLVSYLRGILQTEGKVAAVEPYSET